MAARLLVVAFIGVFLILGSAHTYARPIGLGEALEADSGRDLLATTNCRSIHPACRTCRARRDQDKTITVCSMCDPGYTLRAGNPFFCDCAAGYMPVGTTNTCTTCSKGKYCPGPASNGTVPAQSCPLGLTTYISGAKSVAQCFTKPGYGRISKKGKNGELIYSATMCKIGDYNPGGNTMMCQHCPAGLTTRSMATANLQECVAPPGYYMFASKSRKCPKGTYMPTANNASTCIACDNDLTTGGEGSINADDCWLVPKGYYYDAAEDAAKPCPLNTYTDEENNLPNCKPCPLGWMTQDIGTEGLADCLAPPGYELKFGDQNISLCEVGWFKEGWNRNPCIQCGDGLWTDSEGSTQEDDCFVLAGWEALQNNDTGNWEAFPCNKNRYGNNVPMNNLQQSRCTPCPANTFTMDTLTGVPDNTGYQGYENCMLKPGWGLGPQLLADPCYLGTYKPGFARIPCIQCPAAFTTLAEKAKSINDCVVQPGWMVDNETDIAKPCDKGYYGMGGSADNRGGNCTMCPTGYTTQLDAATSVDDCGVCDTGYGGPSCQICPYGTYSVGGTTNDCTQCPQGFTSHRGAGQNSQCLAVWPLNYAGDTVHIILSDETSWTRLANGSDSQDICQQQCENDAACMMYRYSVGDRACDVFFGVDANQPGRSALGFKAWGAGAVQDYSFYYIPSSLTVGEKINDKGGVVSSLNECTAACTGMENCIFVRVESISGGGYNCSLHVGSSDSEWVSSYKISGSGLTNDGLIISTS